MTKVVVYEVIPAKVLPGQIMMTSGAYEAFEINRQHPLEFIRRHVLGEWGEVDAHDKAANDWALLSGRRILSAYALADETRIWLITEADRSITTILLPEEY